MNALTTLIAADVTLERAGTAPADYAAGLTALVAEGWADRLPMGAKGRPTGDRADALAEVTAGYRAAGLSASAAKNRVTRLTYALAILAAPGNARREEETDDAYVARVSKIRTIANAGDVEAITRAIDNAAKVASPRKGRGVAKVQGGKAAKGGKADKPVTEAKPVDKGERYTAAHNALVAALTEYATAVEEYVADGGKVTKASAQQIGHRLAVVAGLVA